MQPLKLPRPGGETLAYLRRQGQGPGLLWAGGFKSDMTATKAAALDDWAWKNGRALVRFDYFGHGASSGRFEDGNITLWRGDALAALDELTQGPQIVLGSSMGAWIALLAALARPERIKGLILIAPAADFTEELMWRSFSDEARTAILREGQWQRPSAYDPAGYTITRQLIEDGRQHLLLDRPIEISAPIRILQGLADQDVPWPHAMRLAEALAAHDLIVTLIGGGDHRLSKPHEIARMIAAVEEMSAL